MKKRGFTLIELLVVISIISLLSSIVLAAVNTASAKGRDAKRLADLRQVVNALELYRTQNNSYPPSTAAGCTGVGWCSGCDQPQGMWTVLAPLVSQGLIKQIPSDPRPNSTGCFNYEYFSTSTNQSTGFTCGGDGVSINGEDIGKYPYAIRFTMEVTKVNLPKFDYGWQGRHGLEYCILGAK